MGSMSILHCRLDKAAKSFKLPISKGDYDHDVVQETYANRNLKEYL